MSHFTLTRLIAALLSSLTLGSSLYSMETPPKQHPFDEAPQEIKRHIISLSLQSNLRDLYFDQFERFKTITAD